MKNLPLHYERDGAKIYAESYATVKREARLERFSPDCQAAVIRMIHACGMVEIADRVSLDPNVGAATRASLQAGNALLCDCEMVRAGIIARYLPEGVKAQTMLNDPSVPELARELGITRSAAQVELWKPVLENAVVVIGNAPTALFYLLEAIDAGAPKPAAIIACPVGFVGAAESKAELAGNPRAVPYLTLRGRRGGSAITAAALNGLAAGLPEIT